MSLRIKTSLLAAHIVCAVLLLLGSPVRSQAAPQDNTPAPDNTRVNRDAGVTADQQKENKNDRELARQIRKALIADKNLSTYAHNIKIIASNGSVTLRGPVRSEDERAVVEAKAKGVTGVGDVKNELTVAARKAKQE
jgi:hyperosmotically inducible periplasmic protein